MSQTQASAQKAGGGSSVSRTTFLLLAVLLLIGAAGAGSYWVLGNARLSTDTTNLAKRVCTAYQHADYDQLIAAIDPAPVPPKVPGDFTSAAQVSLKATLRSLDSRDGTVSKCQYAPSGSGASQTRVPYTFTLTRAKATSHPLTLQMTFVREKNGTWEIARDSDFFGTTP
ncbi:MAG TPA: hypothetical protein VFU88_20610 [Ktedonobacterales bacterium]|nr:hypothetical protein [Ktedonobacterales bacterium]